jgi:GT2 family glycosyltransferase
MSPLLTIQVVGWNSARTLPAAVRALQTIPSDLVVIRYIDNASTDESVGIVRSALPQADIIKLSNNQGFAGAHNVGFKKCTTPFILTHDPDIELNWAGVEQLLSLFANSKLGAVQGLLHRFGSADAPVIDSAGITFSLSFNGLERGSNQPDHHQYDTKVDIRAVTGACGLYRVAAVQGVAHQANEFFDADFFAYKEDVDLGWRLTRGGWTVQYAPITMGIHNRTLGRRGLFNWGLQPKRIAKRLRSPRTRYSFRNWIWLIAKHATWWQLLWHSPFILGRLLVWAVLSCLYVPFFKVWAETIHGLPRMLAKR